MSSAMFDLAQRILAERRHTPVPRLWATPVPVTEHRIAVRCIVRPGEETVVIAADSAGRVCRGEGGDGLTALVDAARLDAGDQQPVTALVADASTVRNLGRLAERWAKSEREATRRGAAVAGWWCERAAHPGSMAVVNLVDASAAKYAIGVKPGHENANLWREWIGVTDASLSGLHEWWAVLDRGPRLMGLESVWSDDRWLWEHTMTAVENGRSWDTYESPALAALRLRSRCDAADLWEGALLSDRYWRERAICDGTVCVGEVASASSRGDRMEVVTDQLVTRLKAGGALTGWIGGAASGSAARFHGTVHRVRAEGQQLRITVTGLGRRGSRPAAADTVTLLPELPNPSVQLSARAALRALYRQRASWIGHGVIATPQRRAVPLEVMVAAADDEQTKDTA